MSASVRSAACSHNRGRDASPTTFPALSPAESAAYSAIRDEGLNRSKIPETAEYLCNVIGPRLIASPALRKANEWTRDTLTNWGLSDEPLTP